MTERKTPYYITTAIAYASAKPHIGNTYEAIMTDAVARYRKCRGYDVFFCTGTDEHGQKIQNYAEKAGLSPKAYVDGVAGVIRGIWDKMNVGYDKFIRTTDDYHVATVQKIFEKFLKNGDIYKGYYEGWYCTPDESFFTDSQVTDGKCPDCGAPLIRAREEAYFFNMQKYAPRLIDYINTHPGFIEPESRKNEMLNNFLLPGLQDLCVSRTSFSWGIEVPSDPKHVVYVWLDALSNYITAIGYDPDKSYEEQSERFKELWPCDVHMIGKDIIRFHTIYWPIFLMALGLPLPKKVFGHPWFLFGTDKMSKSKGNVIYADELAETVGVDGVRYYALAEMPYSSDGNITWERVFKRYNTDLVNNLGNLVKRTLDMQKKYFDCEIRDPGQFTDLDFELEKVCLASRDEMFAAMDGYRVADAVAAVLKILDRANKYIDETTPWVLAKDPANRARLATVLYSLLSAIRFAAVLLYPFIPGSAETILSQLGCEDELCCIKEKGCVDYAAYAEFVFGALRRNGKVSESKVLFARIDEAAELAKATEKAAAAAAAAGKTDRPAKPEGCAEITIDSFMNVELRTAQVTGCEPVPKAKKLLKLKIDLGYEERQIVSGIAKFYKSEDLIGKKVIVVANLRPAVLCGEKSEGMLLASGEETVRVVFLDPDTPLGDRVR